MSIITPAGQITPEELLELPDAINFELVDGQLVERHMGSESSEICGRIVVLIGIFLRKHKLGHLLTSEGSYQCFPDASRKVRRPDASFIRNGRLKDERVPKGHVLIPPDLAIEVVSPGDLAYEVDEKIAEYIGAGVPLVWVVYPPSRTVEVRRPRSSPLGPISHLNETDMISGEEVLPGFSASVREFFE